MTANEFCEIARKIATEYKTLYILGCFGAPMNAKNKLRYTNNQVYNGKPVPVYVGKDANDKAVYVEQPTKEGAIRKKMILSASEDTFGFDCVCLIKGILSGWCGDLSRTYGGSSYPFVCPDMGADTLINRYCSNISKDFTKIKRGEIVWMPGHVGIYVGNGEVVECSPAFENKVQITNLGNVGKKTGNWRNWSKHGLFTPYIEYDENHETTYVPKPEEQKEVGQRTYKVQKGDILSKIAKQYNTTVDKIVKDNAINHKSLTTNKDLIRVGWILKV